MTTREEFLDARRFGIGGSDVASLFNVGYGCRRRLWYDKRSTPQDFPRETTKAMELGTFLEPFFADEYGKSSGRPVFPIAEAIQHPKVEHLRVNIDRGCTRLEVGDTGGPVVGNTGGPVIEDAGVLEIKSCGRDAFFKYKREGLPPDYILQLQAGIAAMGTTWGAFVIGCRDNGQHIAWDVDRDEDICGAIEAAVEEFWPLVENGPMPDALEPDDARCQRCEYRRTCQGNALVQLDAGSEMPQMEVLRPLLSEYDEKKTAFDEAESAYDGVREEIKSELADKQAVMVGERKVYYRPQSGRVTWLGKELAEATEAFVGHVITELTNGTLTIDDVVSRAPAREKFQKQGNPFKTLRIY